MAFPTPRAKKSRSSFRQLRALLVALGLLAIAVPHAAKADGGPGAAIIPVSNGGSGDACVTNSLARNDDGSTSAVPLNFAANFFGTTYNNIYLNNNGNGTFNSALSTYTPFPLLSTSTPIIAPFFADVDTRGSASGLLTYGSGTLGGHTTLCALWDDVGVGYYYAHTDKLNKFQMLLIDRSDTGAGNFDIEFNYNQIQWETGDVSGGVNGLGGSSARVGYSNGTSAAGSFELPGSGIPGSFLDTNPALGLIYHSLGSTQPGRYIFQVRNGTVVVPPSPTATPELGSGELLATGLLPLAAVLLYRRRRARPGVSVSEDISTSES